MHKEFGKTYVPVFDLVSWTEAGDIDLSDRAESAALPAPAKGQRAANPTSAASKAAESKKTPQTKFPSSRKF